MTLTIGIEDLYLDRDSGLWFTPHASGGLSDTSSRFHSGHPGRLHVYGVRVHPVYRRQGHGRFLMDVMAAYADSRGLGLELRVEVNNERAIAFYRSLGFEIHGLMRQMRDGRRTFLMVRPTREGAES